LLNHSIFVIVTAFILSLTEIIDSWYIELNICLLIELYYLV